MGYWNEVCLMSCLPILSNEAVHAFILLPRIDATKEGAVCYKDDKYVPIGFPIQGKYNEYGGVDDIVYPKILDSFFPNAYEYLTEYTDEDGNKSFKKYEWVSLQRFIDDIASRDVYVKTADGKTHRLALAMVHSELYQRLLTEISNRVPYSYYDNIRGLVEVKIRKHMDKLQEARDEFAKRYGQQAAGFARFTDTYFNGNTAYFFMNKLANIYMETKDESIIQNMTDYMLWMMAMDFSNKGYLCSITGSQDEEYRIPHIIADFIIERCKRRIEEARQNRDEDEEENSDILAETIYFWDE